MEWLKAGIGIAAAGYLVLAGGLAAQEIEYSAARSDDGLHSTVRAVVGGKTYTIIDKIEACLEIADQRDWDGNGLVDALVERVEGLWGKLLSE